MHVYACVYKQLTRKNCHEKVSHQSDPDLLSGFREGLKVQDIEYQFPLHLNRN